MTTMEVEQQVGVTEQEVISTENPTIQAEVARWLEDDPVRLAERLKAEVYPTLQSKADRAVANAIRFRAEMDAATPGLLELPDLMKAAADQGVAIEIRDKRARERWAPFSNALKALERTYDFAHYTYTSVEDYALVRKWREVTNRPLPNGMQAKLDALYETMRDCSRAFNEACSIRERVKARTDELWGRNLARSIPDEEGSDTPGEEALEEWLESIVNKEDGEE